MMTYKYRNGLWPMQYVFLIRSSAGGKKYVTRRSRVTYFLPPARERIKNTYWMGQRPFLYFYTVLCSSNMQRKQAGQIDVQAMILSHEYVLRVVVPLTPRRSRRCCRLLTVHRCHPETILDVNKRGDLNWRSSSPSTVRWRSSDCRQLHFEPGSARLFSSLPLSL